jgi:hypothetical protein
VKPFLDGLSQPEYVHVLLNPLPIYGLAAGVLALVVALAMRSRAAQMTGLIVILSCALSAWLAYQYGERGYYRVKAMADAEGGRWLDAHRQRAEEFIWGYYILAGVAAVAIALPIFWPSSTLMLATVTLLGALVMLGAGGWIAYAGGKVRHREFRNEPAPAAQIQRTMPP